MHKFWNFSQNGVSTDPIYIHSSIKQRFGDEFQKQIKQQHGVYTKTNLQVAPSLQFSKHAVEYKQLPSGNEKELQDQHLMDELDKSPKSKEEIGEPLMKDEMVSPLVSIVEYDTAQTIIEELRKIKPAGIYYYGSKGSKAHQLVQDQVQSAYFITNDSPLQQCNVFAPFKHAGACGLGRIKGYEGIR